MKVPTIALFVTAVSPLAGQQDAEAQLTERLVSVTAQLRSPDSRLRWRGVTTSIKIGAPAVPMLMKLLGKRDANPLPVHVSAAAMALTRMGKEAVPCLEIAREMVADAKSRHCGELGLDLLAFIGPHDSEDLESNKRAIYDQLRSSSRKRAHGIENLACSMIRLLGAIDMSVGEILDHLEGSSEGHLEMALDRLYWRMQGKSSLARDRDLGKAAEGMSVALLAIVTGEAAPKNSNFRFRGKNWGWGGNVRAHRGEEIREKAALLLQLVAPGKRLPAAAHVALLRHPDPAVRRRSVLSIGALGAGKNAAGEIGESVVLALIRATGDSDKMVGWDAITALGMLGTRASSAIKVLEDFVANAKKPTAVRSKAALSLIRPRKDK